MLAMFPLRFRYHVISCQEFESIFNKNSAILDAPLEVFDEMDVEPLAPGTTRREMPVFMLDVAACPGGVVPLHIFEMRYRQVGQLLVIAVVAVALVVLVAVVLFLLLQVLLLLSLP